MIHSAGPDPSWRPRFAPRGPALSNGPWFIMRSPDTSRGGPDSPCRTPRSIPWDPGQSCRLRGPTLSPESWSVPRGPETGRGTHQGPLSLGSKQAAYLSFGGGGGGKRYVGPSWFLFDGGQWPWPECPPPPPPGLDRHRIHPEGPWRVPEGPDASWRALTRPGGPWRVLKGPDASRRALIRPADHSSSRGPWSIPPAMIRLVRPQFVPRGPAPSRFLIRLIGVLIPDWIHGAFLNPRPYRGRGWCNPPPPEVFRG